MRAEPNQSLPDIPLKSISAHFCTLKVWITMVQMPMSGSETQNTQEAAIHSAVSLFHLWASQKWGCGSKKGMGTR